MISYYDIRDARTAMRALQNKPLRRRKLDIHFSIPKVHFSCTIQQIFSYIFILDCFYCVLLISHVPEPISKIDLIKSYIVHLSNGFNRTTHLRKI
jgi:hypothetical protein